MTERNCSGRHSDSNGVFSPAKNSPIGNSTREKKVTWLEPQLVARIAFQEWLADLKLRQPIFLGARNDKEPSEIFLPN
jgi:ATP-dependent DNA ligase